MAKDKGAEIERLNKYAEGLRRRLTGAVPTKHVGAEKEFKQMLQIDLLKTELKLKELGQLN